MPAHAIPKIEWKNLSLTATRTGGSNTLTSVTTTNIEVGMLIEGTGIPAGTTVLSKTVSTVVMSANASNPGTSSLAFLYRIEFEFPPIEKAGEQIDSKERQSVSISGKVQTSIDFIEAKRTLNFSFLSQALYESLKSFFITHGYAARPFLYYEDKTLGASVEYELSDLKFMPTKIVPKGFDYVWSVVLKMRRVF